jgi:hypothetical protein
MRPKRIALWFLIVSVAISAVLGIIAILTGDFGSLQIRVILTTLTISAASICALTSGALWEARGQRVLPTAGIVLALSAAALIITAIWLEIESEQYLKFMAATGVMAIATAHDCLLSLARLARRFIWARVVALASVYGLALFVIVCIYSEPGGDLAFRVIGALAIVVAAITIIIPIFHRLSRDDFQKAVAKPESDSRGRWATITCPQCGTSQPNSLAATECEKCGCRFVVSILAEGGVPNLGIE